MPLGNSKGPLDKLPTKGSEEGLWREYQKLKNKEKIKIKGLLSKQEFLRSICTLESRDKIVTAGSLYYSFVGSIPVELLKQPEVKEEAIAILNELQQYLRSMGSKNYSDWRQESLVQDMLNAFARVIVANIE